MPRTSTRQREQLARTGLRLVEAEVQRRIRRGTPSFDADELQSIGRFALARVLQRYDPSRGSSFTTFARPRIRGALIDAIRKQCRRRVRLRPVAATARYGESAAQPLRPSGSAFRGDRGSSELERNHEDAGLVISSSELAELAMCPAPNPEAALEARQELETLRRTVEAMPVAQQRMLHRHLAGESVGAASRQMGISRKRGSRLLDRSMTGLAHRLRRGQVPRSSPG
jgi:RNA polymerase sigma factor FliA